MKHFLIVAFPLGRWHTMRFLRRYVRNLPFFKAFTRILGMKASTKLCFILLTVITLCYLSDLGFLSIFHRVYQPTGRATAIATAMRFLSGGWNLGAVPLSRRSALWRSSALALPFGSFRLQGDALRLAVVMLGVDHPYKRALGPQDSHKHSRVAYVRFVRISSLSYIILYFLLNQFFHYQQQQQ